MAKNVIVVGGGIIGLCCAYYLQKEGHQVTIIDKSKMDSGASFVNAGYLVPSHFIPLSAPGMINQGIRYMFNSTSPFYIKPRWDSDFLKWAWFFKKSCTAAKVERAIPVIRDLNLFSKQLFETIKASGDLGNFHLEKKGLLMVYQTKKYEELEGKNAERARELGLEVTQLSAEALKEIEPKRALNALGAYHYLCDAQTTPPEFMKAMTNYLSEVRVQIRQQEGVVELQHNGDKIQGVTTDKNAYTADEVVLAMGSWSSGFTKKLGWNLPMQAGKGYGINLRDTTGITMPALLCEAKIAVSPMRGFTRFAGTMEFSGINHHIRRERVAAIAQGVAKYYPGLSIPEEAINTAQYGLRPVSPDGLPYIGRYSKIKNLVVATGHAMMGWSLGPATGKLISEVVSDKKLSLETSSFHPERKF